MATGGDRDSSPLPCGSRDGLANRVERLRWNHFADARRSELGVDVVDENAFELGFNFANKPRARGQVGPPISRIPSEWFSFVLLRK